MYRYAEYLHFPEIAWSAFLDRLQRRLPASRLEYGPDPHQVAYYLRPAADGSEGEARPRRPLIVYVHGGGWRRGHPSQFRFVGRYFARLGYSVLIPGYRLGPTYQFPDQIEDLRRGIETFQQTPFARRQGFSSVVVIGQSAGGHLGAHIAYELARKSGAGSELLAPAPIGVPLRVQGFISISGVLSFETAAWRYLEGLIKNTAATAGLRRIADPRHAVDTADKELPTLLIHGGEDRIVPQEIGREYAKRHTERFGSPPARLDLPWAKHNELALLFLGRRGRATALMVQWLRAAEERKDHDAE